MFRFLGLISAFLLIHLPFAQAYEFKKIDHLFAKINSDYSESLDIRQISLSCGKVLNQFDNDFKLYSTDSKAYLYFKQNLVRSFNLPQDNSLVSWQKTLEEILSTGVTYSPKISDKTTALENEILKMMMHHLDKYSRIETLKHTQNNFDYTLKDNILYIRPAFFDDKTAANLKNIIGSYSNLSGLVLDLRNNRGGNFNGAIKTADLFLDDTLITYSKEKNHPTRYYSATTGDILNNKPIVVLTDEYTASAAELVVAALGEQNRAVIMGTRTYGKGSIQHIFNADGEKLYLTSGYFYTPSGKPINNMGITPQICTGINNSCQISDKSDSKRDIAKAFAFIKNHLG